MDKSTTRRMEFEALFTRYGKESDRRLLPENFAGMADHEWVGLLHSINLILSRRAAREKAT